MLTSVVSPDNLFWSQQTKEAYGPFCNLLQEDAFALSYQKKNCTFLYWLYSSLLSDCSMSSFIVMELWWFVPNTTMIFYSIPTFKILEKLS